MSYLKDLADLIYADGEAAIHDMGEDGILVDAIEVLKGQRIMIDELSNEIDLLKSQKNGN